jgi:hypothetical protein
MKNEDLFRIAFHYPDIMQQALVTLPYFSPVRKSIEAELIALRKRSATLRNDTFSISNLLYKVVFTMETFHTLVSIENLPRIDYENAYSRYDNGRPYSLMDLCLWWRKHLHMFKVSDAPIVTKIIQAISNSFNTTEYLISINHMMPEDPVFDDGRKYLRETVMRRIQTQKRTDAVSIAEDIFGFSMDLVRDWPVDSKKFGVVRVPDAVSVEMLKEIPNYSKGSYARGRMTSALMLALRSEDEFLSLWKDTTDAWRVTLASFHGKISKPLLDKLLKRYNRNGPIIEALLNHPLADIETVSWFALRGNPEAQRVIHNRKNELNGGSK